MAHGIADPYYSRISYLWICLLVETYLLFAKTNTHSVFTDIHRHGQGSKKFKLPICMLPDEVEQVNILPSCFSFHTVNKVYSVLRILRFGLLIVVSLFKVPPKCSAVALYCVPKCGTVVMCLKKKTHVLHKLLLGMSYNAVGCELHVNEWAIYIKYGFFKKKYT